MAHSTDQNGVRPRFFSGRFLLRVLDGLLHQRGRAVVQVLRLVRRQGLPPRPMAIECGRKNVNTTIVTLSIMLRNCVVRTISPAFNRAVL